PARSPPRTINPPPHTARSPPPAARGAASVGAGPPFSGPLIISLLKGKSLSEDHHFAVKTAAFVCTKEGAWPVYEE
ncbi:MAG: carbohydrate kinase, partial [Parabacteroides sp.]|nr:carbohydrate kinase [Parabacteroides sp.]